MSTNGKRRTETVRAAGIAMAGLLLLAAGGCIGLNARSIQKTYEVAMSRGDLAQAEQALFRLAARGHDVSFQRAQLDKAQEIESLLELARRQVAEEDFASLPGTWKALDKATAEWKAQLESTAYQSRDPEVPLPATGWSEAYFRHLEKDRATFKARWDEAREERAARAQEAFAAAVKEERWEDAEKQLAVLRDVQVPIAVPELQLHQAQETAQLREDFAQQLESGDFADAEAALDAMEKLGADVSEQREELRQDHLEASTQEFEEALAAGEYEKAEALYATIQRLDGDVQALKEEVRERKVGDLQAEFQQALKGGDFDRAEAMLARFSDLSAPTEAPAESIRTGRIGAIRGNLEEEWQGKDFGTLAENCRKLRALGNDTADLEQRFQEVFDDTTMAFVRGLKERLDDQIATPDFEQAWESVAAFEQAWRNGFGSILSDPSIPRLAKMRRGFEAKIGEPRYRVGMYEKAYYLRDRASVGLRGPEGKVQYWVRCAPKTLLEDPDYQVEDLRVQMLGYACNVHRAEGKASEYQLAGVNGGSVDVVSDLIPPMEGELVYLLGTVELQDGRFRRVLEHRTYVPAKQPGEVRDGIEVPTRQDIKRWMNFDYDYTLENLFRRFVCVKGRTALPLLTEGDWSEGARTSADEAEEYFRTHE